MMLTAMKKKNLKDFRVSAAMITQVQHVIIANGNSVTKMPSNKMSESENLHEVIKHNNLNLN